MNEKELVENIKKGSHKAFDSLYKLYAKRLYAFCMSYTKSVDDSSDIVQDVFEKIWKNRDALDPDASISSFIFTIAKNELINSYKKCVNSHIYEEYIIYKNLTSVNEGDRLEYKFFLEHVTEKMKSLPKTQQKAIRLSRFEGLSVKEISALMNMTEETIRNQISLGTKKLKQILGTEKYIELLIISFLLNH